MNTQSKIEAAHDIPVIEYLPLADLTLSDLNPRQEVSEEGIALLADSLVTCGLIQNLAGIMDAKGKVAIVAGGRRLRALAIAVNSRPDLGIVPVQIAANATIALQWANAENTARIDLDAVDEIRAYLQSWRMTIAKDLLRRGHKNIAQVASEVGYGSASAFSRQTGQPPGQFARQNG